MKYVEDYENIPGKEWPVRPYYKRELAEAYAPTISPASVMRWKRAMKIVRVSAWPIGSRWMSARCRAARSCAM